MAHTLRRRLAAFAGLFAILLLGSPMAQASPEPWQLLGSGQAFVAKSGDQLGVCAGDDQLRKGAPLTPADAPFSTFSVGSAVARNMKTSIGNTDLKNVMEADKTWIVAALYDTHAATATKGRRQAESFSWAVQSQLAAFGRFPMGRLSDDGKLARQMISDAEKVAGPYLLDLWSSQSEGRVVIDNIGVKGRAGWIAGLPIEITLTHPLTGEVKKNLTSALEPQSVEVDFEAPGEVEIYAVANGLPASTIKIWEHPKHQDLVVVPGEKSSIEARGSIEIPVEKLQLAIDTQVKAASIRAAESPVDLVTVSADKWPVGTNGKPVSLVLRAELYGPMETLLEQTSNVPLGMSPIAHTLFTIDQAGTFETPELALADELEPGFYTWVVSALADDQQGSAEGLEAARLEADVISDFAVPSETFFVEYPPREVPPVETQPSEPTTVPELPDETEPPVESEPSEETQPPSEPEPSEPPPPRRPLRESRTRASQNRARSRPTNQASRHLLRVRRLLLQQSNN
ncbi:MAG: hypothetical protein Q4E01_01285 [Actinomycetaceae bacterium]|nr:hypothetical protein [Actinomycetaceae bacterium]